MAMLIQSICVTFLICIVVAEVSGTSLYYKQLQDYLGHHVEKEVSTEVDLGKTSENLSDFVKLLFHGTPQTDPVVEHHTDKHLWERVEESGRLGASFQWKDCGGASDAVHITSLTVSPVPLKIPGNVQIGFNFVLTSNINSSISVDVEVKKKIGPIFITVKNVHIPDLCSALAPKTCPTQFSQCHCPYKKGSYSLPPTSFSVSGVSIPGGQYHVTAWLKHSNAEVACLYLEFSVA